MDAALTRTRTRWDIALGILLVVLGIYLLSNSVLATAITVLAIAWTVLIAGVMMLVAALIAIRSDFSWSTLLGGAVLTALGIVMLRSPVLLLATAAVLTMLAGAMFLVSGVVRIGLGMNLQQHKWLLIISGLISIGLGLWVLFNPGTATLQLLGILLGVQVLVEGITLLAAGRLRMVDASNEQAPAAV